jgi:hypothetical protein
MFINFLETFFFLSLGIAFVLILLIVYHFKQQITSIEEKSDTLFDIIQNLAKELTVLKSQQHLNNNSSMPMFYSSNNENLGNIPIFQPPMRVFNPNVNIEQLEENDDDDEDADDDDEDADDDDDNEDQDDDDHDDDDDDDNDENADDDNTFVYKKIKVDDNIIQGEPVTNLEEIQEETFQNKELQHDSQIQELDLNLENNTTNIEDIDIDEYNKETASSNTESYKRMNLTALKNVVLSRGIQVDMSKMKKNDLIKLLQ